jgi:hypothetical protein
MFQDVPRKSLSERQEQEANNENDEIGFSIFKFTPSEVFIEMLKIS